MNVHLEHGTVCLTTDVWSNIKNELIVNYMTTSLLTTLFLESVSTGEQSHNSEWIASDIGDCLERTHVNAMCCYYAKHDNALYGSK